MMQTQDALDPYAGPVPTNSFDLLPPITPRDKPSWLGLDNWKTLFRATYPEPIRELQIACRYKFNGGELKTPDPEFMRVCLTTATDRVKRALRHEGKVVDEDPSEWLWLVASKLGFGIPEGAEKALCQIVENEKMGLCKFLDVDRELKSLRESLGIKLALVSNAWPFPMPQIFNESEGGLSVSSFDSLILSYEVGHAKQSAEFYQEMLRRCGTQGADCMMVGDNPELDVRMPVSVGMRAVLIDRYGDCQDKVEGIPVIRQLRNLYQAAG